MQTLQEIYKKQKKVLFFLLALFVLGWGFTDLKPIFAGLALGSLFGLYNFWILVRRMERFDRELYGREEKSITWNADAFRIRCGCGGNRDFAAGTF